MIPIDRLYIATISGDAKALAQAHGVGLELDVFCTAANMDPPDFDTWDAEARACLAASDHFVFHAPFAELCPAAIDPKVRKVVRGRFDQAFALASSYGIRRMVVHGGVIPHVYFPEWFVEQSVSFWKAFLEDKPADLELLIENVLEDDPKLQAEIITGIGDPRVRACLDIGHANVQSGLPLTAWVDTLAPYLGHVHLHNNHGNRDSHNALQDGSILVKDLLHRLREKAPEATYTLEMMDSAASSLQWLLETPEKAVPPAPAPEVELSDDARAMLKHVFGYDDFRPGQRTLIDAELTGRDALGIMPTGSGKSICFQLPALLMEGITLVVSPLISLMKDQVAALNQSGVRAAFLNSSLTERQFDLALRNAEAGEYRLIYVAPERLMTPRFLAFSQRANIALLAVDEAHCISQWGQDFRPSYLDVPRYVQALPRRPVVSAFTATATQQVKEDIIRLLALRDPVQVQTGFDRPNLYFEVLRPKKKADALLALMARYPGQSGIIYCATRKNVEETCELLRAQGISATRYHAGLSDVERRGNQEDFTYDRSPVIVATNAFGMGIDKSNVRFIIHYNMPKDLESYYQEAGRAGRDGDPAECVLLYSGQDEGIQRRLIEYDDGAEGADPQIRQAAQENALRRLAEMVMYCRTQGCLRQHLLRYFGQELPEPCGNCGSCASQTEAEDYTEIASAILRCVYGTGSRFGLGTIIEVLRGKESARLRDFGLSGQELFGALADVKADLLRAVGDQLIAEGYLRVKEGRLPIVKLGERAGEVLEDGETVYLRLPQVMEAPSVVQRRRRTREGRERKPVARPAVAVSADDASLFEALRTLRLRLSTELGVPAYVVFSDATLREMATSRPHTPREMMMIKGIGDAKFSQFGKIFLEQIAAFDG